MSPVFTDGLSTAQAARRLNLTPTRIRQLMAEGRLEFVHTPLGRLIDAECVERLRVERERKERGHGHADR